MSNKKIDDSIYQDVKRDLNTLLEKYPKKSLVEDDKNLDAYIVICDDKCIKQINTLEKRLNIEYGFDEVMIKSFGITSLLKYLNTEFHAHYYKLYKKELWEQVNDQDKVRDRLDGKFAKWKNTMKKRTLEKLSAKGVDSATKAKVESDMNKEITEAKKELEYIKDNFDSLNVRISEYEHRRAYTGITVSLTLPSELKKLKGKNKIESVLRMTLRKDVANILWYKELNEDDKLNELQRFLKYAKHAFGDVYYLKSGEDYV